MQWRNKLTNAAAITGTRPTRCRYDDFTTWKTKRCNSSRWWRRRTCHSVTEPGVWKLVGVWTQNIGLTRGLSRAPYAWVLVGNLWPLPSPEKNWIWDWRRCNFPLSWGPYLHSSVSILRRYAITFSIPPLPHIPSSRSDDWRSGGSQRWCQRW